jgi:hypothetical protein
MGFMNVVREDGGFVVELSCSELIDLIDEKNPDKSEVNKKYIDSMIEMICRNREKKCFSHKQMKWIMSKVRFVFNRNKRLGMSGKNIKGIVFV